MSPWTWLLPPPQAPIRPQRGTVLQDKGALAVQARYSAREGTAWERGTISAPRHKAFTLSGQFADVAAAGGAALLGPGTVSIAVTPLQAGAQGAPQHHGARARLCCKRAAVSITALSITAPLCPWECGCTGNLCLVHGSGLQRAPAPTPLWPPSCPHPAPVACMGSAQVCVRCAHPGRRMHTPCIARRGVGMGAAGTCVRGGAGQPTAREAALLVPGAVPVIGAQVGADSITPGSLPWAKAGFGWRGQGAQGTAQSQPGPAALMHCSHSDETANPCLCSMARPAQHKHSPPVAVNLTWLSSQAADAAPLPMATCRLVAAAHPAAHPPGAAQGLCEGRSTVCWGARLTRGTHPLSSSSSPTAPHTCSREQAGVHIPEKAALLSTGAAVVRQAVPPGGACGAAPHCRAHACFAGGRQGGWRPLAPLCPAWWGAGSGGIAAIPTVLLG